MEIVRLIIMTLCVFLGLFILGVATLGMYRFKYVLNRVHVAAKCDTLATLLILVGLIVVTGFNFNSVKLFLLIVFMWLTGPVAVHVIGETEIITNPNLEEECEVYKNDLY